MRKAKRTFHEERSNDLRIFPDDTYVRLFQWWHLNSVWKMLSEMRNNKASDLSLCYTKHIFNNPVKNIPVGMGFALE